MNSIDQEEQLRELEKYQEGKEDSIAAVEILIGCVLVLFLVATLLSPFL